jgi:hypothetical protein
MFTRLPGPIREGSWGEGAWSRSGIYLLIRCHITAARKKKTAAKPRARNRIISVWPRTEIPRTREITKAAAAAMPLHRRLITAF